MTLLLGGILVILFIAPLFGDDYGSSFISILTLVFVSVLGFVASAIALFVFLLPTLVAVRRGHHNTVPILLVNVFFGLTIIGWVLALIWSVSAINPNLKPF